MALSAGVSAIITSTRDARLRRAGKVHSACCKNVFCMREKCFLHTRPHPAEAAGAARRRARPDGRRATPWRAKAWPTANARPAAGRPAGRTSNALRADRTPQSRSRKDGGRVERVANRAPQSSLAAGPARCWLAARSCLCPCLAGSCLAPAPCCWLLLPAAGSGLLLWLWLCR